MPTRRLSPGIRKAESRSRASTVMRAIESFLVGPAALIASKRDAREPARPAVPPPVPKAAISTLRYVGRSPEPHGWGCGPGDPPAQEWRARASLDPHQHAIRRALRIDHGNARKTRPLRPPGGLPAQGGRPDGRTVDEPRERRRAAGGLERERPPFVRRASEAELDPRVVEGKGDGEGGVGGGGDRL